MTHFVDMFLQKYISTINMKGRSKSQITPQDGLIIHTSQPFPKNVHVFIHAGKCFAMLTVSYMGK